MAGASALLLGLWGILASPSGPPPARPAGAGLPPVASAHRGPQAEEPAARHEAELVAAEAARLAALQAARARLEQEVAALRETEAELRRALSGRAAGEDSPSVAPLGAAAQQPPAASAPAAGAETVVRGPRVVLHYRSGSQAGANAAADVAQTLQAAGVQVQATRAVPFAPSTPVVRYFHAEDQAAAARLAGRLGRGWAIQDFRAVQPQPAPQTLEVWLPAD